MIQKVVILNSLNVCLFYKINENSTSFLNVNAREGLIYLHRGLDNQGGNK